jgi:RimJ/RimL family protein N-acetyltransferase
VTESTSAKADLIPFSHSFAQRVASWIDSAETYCNMTGELTEPPEDVVESWQQVDVKAFLLMAHGQPLAYGEIWDRPVELAAEIGHLIVDPARRGRGYGTKMLQLLTQRAAQNARVRRVILNFHGGDETVLGCYLKAGFELVASGSGGEGLRMEMKVD